MELESCPDAASAAQRAAAIIATQARGAVASRGRFLLAVSGGETPGMMLRALAGEAVPWERVELWQVDERVVPAGDPRRNLVQLGAMLLESVPLPPQQLHAMPVDAPDLDAAARRHDAELVSLAGVPPVLDCVHLGLGEDGHIASLVPGDPVLTVTDRSVAMTGPYGGTRRMTLTFPVLASARQVVWLVCGAKKAGMLGRLLAGDPSIPAGMFRAAGAVVVADAAARGAPAPR
jgi:6-phosphogluconolactonase